MMPRSCLILSSIAAVALLSGCQREHRVFDPGATGAQVADGVQLTSVHVGDTSPQSTPYAQYAESAYAVAEGKRLYNAYNCVGCHANGGGGIGPALMDAEWIYGSKPEQIFSTIVQGRPNGMPSFAGKIPDYQVWELVAYVRSLSGQLPSDIAPSRSDTMAVKKPEQSKKKEHPSDEYQQPIQQEKPQ